MISKTAAYNYIIVGAGPAGCVIANRLSADPDINVLLIEAGGKDDHPGIADIGGFIGLLGSDIDWSLRTTPQPGMLNREIVINQGKVLGGSSAINAMMYVRGNQNNFDQWKASGAKGWGYDDVLPYFKRVENYDGGDTGFHGDDGEVNIAECPDADMRSPQFLQAVKNAGFCDANTDYNGAQQSNTAAYLQFHIDENNERVSAATAFLNPVMYRSNLTVLINAQVKNIIIENEIAVGVEYVIDGELVAEYVFNEVIISAGTLASPKILMLSGIGPAEDLQALDIEIVKDLPGVGKNLQDHIQVPIIYNCNIAVPNTTLLTGNVVFLQTKPELNAPNIQVNFTPSRPKPLAALLPDTGKPICIFLAILVQPKSAGELKLASADYTQAPIINPHYLEDEADMEALNEAISTIRKVASQPAFSELNAGEAFPGEVPVADYIRAAATTIWHPTGTCKMGNGADAVVDSRLKVNGIKNLRVADASVMPVTTSGNTVATCFMIGEKAAEMILQDNLNLIKTI